MFTQPETWTGGSYALAIELVPRDDDVLRRALEAVWTAPSLEGCYLMPDREPHDQPHISITAAALNAPVHGVARIGARPVTACRTVAIRYDESVDWLYLCLPLGALGRAAAIGPFPFSNGGNLAWRTEVDEWLCDVARRVFQAVPFRLGLVGWDGGELDDLTTFDASNVALEHWIGYLVAAGGRLEWAPTYCGRADDDGAGTATSCAARFR